MTFAEQVQAVIDGTLKGDILGTFERWYADDVVMSENGTEDRVGKDLNRTYEEAFVANMEFHSASVGRVCIDDERQTAAVEWVFEMTPKAGGDRIVQKQVAFQTWKDGLVVHEIFYYKGG